MGPKWGPHVCHLTMSLGGRCYCYRTLLQMKKLKHRLGLKLRSVWPSSNIPPPSQKVAQENKYSFWELKEELRVRKIREVKKMLIILATYGTLRCQVMSKMLFQNYLPESPQLGKVGIHIPFCRWGKWGLRGYIHRCWVSLNSALSGPLRPHLFGSAGSSPRAHRFACSIIL